MKSTLPILTASSLLWLCACSDPADKVHKSGATEPAKTTAATAKPGKEYVVRSGSTIGFSASKVTFTHQGGFKNFAGTMKVDGGKITGLPVIKIALASIWADDERLTRHLKSQDFFDVQNFPTATFTVTSIDQGNVTGNLDLHGVNKSITFPATLEVNDTAVSLKADFAINRRDFNINFPGMPNDLIRDNVVLKLDVKATPGPARPEDQLSM